jgi:hypothetical protein
MAGVGYEGKGRRANGGKSKIQNPKSEENTKGKTSKSERARAALTGGDSRFWVFGFGPLFGF